MGDSNDIRIDDSHVSGHFLAGNPGTYAISQQIVVDGQAKILYTDIDQGGSVGNSGIGNKV